MPTEPRAPTPAFAEADDERARMGRISGVLWTVAATVGIGGAFLPGSVHVGLGWVIAVGALVLVYGVGSVTGAIPWQKASMNTLAVGMLLTVPVVGATIYMTGGAISYIEPFLVCSLLYAAFFFPARWAWPLSIELVLVGAAPLLYDSQAVELAFAPRYLALAASFLAAAWVMIGLKRRLVAAEARQREIANRDPLTGVGNRRAFDETMRCELAARGAAAGRRDRDGAPLALLLFDLDDFKGVNDRHGHEAGDELLRQTAERLLGAVRAGDAVARLGGDEFAIVLEGACSPDEVRAAAWRVRAAFDSAFVLGSASVVMRASVGEAVWPDAGATAEALLRHADAAMYDEKARAQPA